MCLGGMCVLSSGQDTGGAVDSLGRLRSPQAAAPTEYPGMLLAA